MVSHEEIATTNFARKPFRTLSLFAYVCVLGVQWAASQAVQHARIVLSAAVVLSVGALTVLYTPPGWVEARNSAVENAEFAAYWILLGVLSSVGLGSGLHTFLLYLGPHIIRVTNHAVQCGNTSFTAQQSVYWAPTPEYDESAWDCVKSFDSEGQVLPVPVTSILAKVAPAAFLWGLGTALGELPPYFAARAAVRSGKRLAELREVQDSEEAVESKASVGVMEWAKVLVYEGIQKYGFAAVMLAASIPNPLFDLAGMTCGHFGVPFWTFFGATLVGKACVKVMIQVVFYATVFNPASLEALRTGVVGAIQALEDSVFGYQYKSCWAGLPSKYLHGEAATAAAQTGHAVWVEDAPGGGAALPQAALQQCMSCCHTTFTGAKIAEERCAEGCSTFVHGPGVLPMVWQGLVALAIGWFLLTFVESTVQDFLTQRSLAAAEQEEAGGASRAAKRGTHHAPADPTFRPSKEALRAADDGEGGHVAAPVGRTIATRTRSAQRPRSRTRLPRLRDA